MYVSGKWVRVRKVVPEYAIVNWRKDIAFSEVKTVFVCIVYWGLGGTC